MNCTPLLSSHNRFSTLSVDNIPEIDEPVANSQVIQPLERPPEGVPIRRRVWRPRWEQRLLAQFIVNVLDETEGPWRSLRLNIELQTTDTGETRAVKALLDSGATGMFIDQAYIKANRLPTRTLSSPIPVHNVDGTLNEAGSVTEVMELVLRYQNHSERAFFAVTSLGSQKVIMGHSWLQKHNPDIDWSTGEVKMSHCSGSCCSGCLDKIRTEQKLHKLEARHISCCSEGGLPALVEEEDEEETPLEFEDGDRIFITTLHGTPEEI